MRITIRDLVQDDCAVTAQAFARQGWDKPRERYERYLRQQEEGSRDTLVAEADGSFAGYVTILWASEYEMFRRESIPEIADLNVLRVFQRQGIGTCLIRAAERRIAGRADVAGLRVGLIADYGPAQRLYVKLGYVPDGRGVNHGNRFPGYAESVVIDDDLTLALTRRLERLTS